MRHGGSQNSISRKSGFATTPTNLLSYENLAISSLFDTCFGSELLLKSSLTLYRHVRILPQTGIAVKEQSSAKDRHDNYHCVRG